MNNSFGVYMLVAVAAIIMVSQSVRADGEVAFITDRPLDQRSRPADGRADKLRSGIALVSKGEVRFVRERERVLSRPQEYADFLFIHGYNRGFDKATILADGLGSQIQRRPLLFSWPSVGRVDRYFEDRNNAEWAATDLARLLDQHQGYFERTPLIAHSMGTLVLLEALMVSSISPQQVVLMASDIDVDRFKRHYYPALKGRIGCLAIVVADDDRALQTSKTLNGYPRLGSLTSGGDIEDMDVIDVTDINDTLVGHEYFVDNQAVADRIDLWLKSACNR